MRFFVTSKISENLRETPEGYLVCIGVPIARTGQMIYGAEELPLLTPGQDGLIRVTREADEVFRPETVASFEGKPVCIQHPEVEDFFNPGNWRERAKGAMQNVRRGKGEQENDLVADLLIMDGEAIDLVKSGLREVSCGYDAEYLQGAPGYALQKNIVGNHLALVEEGRAGSSYAISDHKGKGQVMTLKEHISKIFRTAEADALKAAEEFPSQKKTGTTDKAAGTGDAEENKGGVQVSGFDEAMKKYLDEKFSSMMPKGDATKEATANTPAESVAKDAPASGDLEARMAKLEAMVAKLVGAGTGDDDGEEEIVGDEGYDDDDDSTKTGDTASRVEILAPGMDAAAKNVKKKALIACYATADGKAAIDVFTGGKAPDLKDEKTVDLLFIGVSESLKGARTTDFANTRRAPRGRTLDSESSLGTPKGALTAEEINKKNAEFYAAQTTQH